MKIRIAHLASALFTFALLFAPVTQAGQTLELTNPGFENDIDDWDPKGDGDMSKAVPEAAHSGSKGLRVTDASLEAGSSLVSKQFDAAGGKFYQARFWARNIEGFGVGVYLRFYDKDGKMIAADPETEKELDLGPTQVEKEQTEWKQLLCRKKAPDGSVKVQIFIHSYQNFTVTADFDDFTLAEVDGE